MTVMDGVVTLTRTYEQPVETVFEAWSNEAAQTAWGDPGDGWQMAFDRFAFRVDEVDICRFGPVEGPEYINRNRYIEIRPNARILYATTLETGGQVTFAGVLAVTFEGSAAGTELRLIESGLYLDGADEVEDHRQGWDSMLDALARYLAAL